jgi:hypothetical protein
VYWTLPSSDQVAASIYPNRVLIFNYKNGSWAYNDDCITFFDYFEQQLDRTWNSTTDTWQAANYSWTSGVVQSQFRQIIAGNQQGYVFVVDSTMSRNAPVMQVTNIATVGGETRLTIIDHTLIVGDYVYIENSQGAALAGTGIYQVLSVIDANTVVINTDFVGIYTGGASATRVSNIQISSKQWNPYIDKGRNVYVGKIVFGVQSTTWGQVTIDMYPSDTYVSLLDDALSSGALLGTGVLETSPYPPTLAPLEVLQERLWHPVYFQAEGETIQLYVYMSDAQMVRPEVSLADFQLEGLVLYTLPTSMRLQ